MKIRKLIKSDLPEIVQIHQEAFAGFFLNTLGTAFLSTYYKACLKSRNIIAIGVIDENNKVLGFAIGPKVSKGFHKQIILWNICSFSLIFFRIIFTNPKAIIRLMFNINKVKNTLDDGNYCELLSIGICKIFQNKGYGKFLIQVFVNLVKQENCSIITLTTDALENDETLGFYKKCGFTLFYEFTAYPERKMYKLIKNINQ
jgi:ribosomal protein S18 acetylase RimI-like enzyme